jgi:ABC-type transport system involved in cytochrome bd biosynthesis fused ATPase/permease subunit
MCVEKETLVQEPVYVTRLEVLGVNCLKGQYTIDFTDKYDKPSMWTVLLGNNNTGKTTLLRCIAGFVPVGEFTSSPIPEDNNLYKDIYHLDHTFVNHSSGLYFQEDPVYNIALYTSDFGDVVVGHHLVSTLRKEEAENFEIDAYGTQRKQGQAKIIAYKLEDRVDSLFSDTPKTLVDVEEWIIGTDYDDLKGDKKAGENLSKIKMMRIQMAGLTQPVND